MIEFAHSVGIGVLVGLILVVAGLAMLVAVLVDRSDAYVDVLFATLERVRVGVGVVTRVAC